MARDRCHVPTDPNADTPRDRNNTADHMRKLMRKKDNEQGVDEGSAVAVVDTIVE